MNNQNYTGQNNKNTVIKTRLPQKNRSATNKKNQIFKIVLKTKNTKHLSVVLLIILLNFFTIMLLNKAFTVDFLSSEAKIACLLFPD